MPKFDVSVPHTLGQQAARERLHGFSEKLQQKYADQLSGLEQSWEGDALAFSFSTFGIGVSGTLEVRDESIEVSGDLPFTAAMFKGKIVGAIQEQLTRLLG
ncbi:MAG: polyhydroxyalkanoic acid system family protein [Planctomycetota bacterium]